MYVTIAGSVNYSDVPNIQSIDQRGGAKKWPPLVMFDASMHASHLTGQKGPTDYNVQCI